VAATAVAVLPRAVLPHLTDTGHGQQTKEKIRSSAPPASCSTKCLVQSVRRERERERRGGGGPSLPCSAALAESRIGSRASQLVPDRIEPRVRSWAEGKVTPAASLGPRGRSWRRCTSGAPTGPSSPCGLTWASRSRRSRRRAGAAAAADLQGPDLKGRSRSNPSQLWYVLDPFPRKLCCFPLIYSGGFDRLGLCFGYDTLVLVLPGW
jgi:hypothetical protein